MVDTVKLLVAVHNPLAFDGSRFAPQTLSELVNSSNYGKTALNPSKAYAKMGVYMPRLTMYKRPSKAGPVYQLAIEFSAPKILHDSNFDELTEADFEQLVTVLRDKLQELIGYRFFKHQIAGADVGTWHPSKNIVFLNYTACQTVLNAISKLDVSRIYDFQKDRYRDGGHVLHIHCNSFEMAFYDKMADLRKAKVSEKRAFEKDSLVQLDLLEKLPEYHPLEVFRYEARFVGRASIKRAFKQLDTWTFETLYKKQLCQDKLIEHWQKLTNSVDLLALDVNQPYELLQNYLEENHDATPKAAMAAVAGLLIISQVGASGLRNTLEAHYGTQAWYRLKPQLISPKKYRFTHFQHIDEALEQFTPIKMSQFLTNIAKN